MEGEKNRKTGAGRLINQKEVSRYQVWFKRWDILTDVTRFTTNRSDNKNPDTQTCKLRKKYIY